MKDNIQLANVLIPPSDFSSSLDMFAFAHSSKNRDGVVLMLNDQRLLKSWLVLKDITHVTCPRCGCACHDSGLVNQTFT